MNLRIFQIILMNLAIFSFSAIAQENKILNIYDAFGKEIEGTELAWGFSAFIRYNGKTILFDGGKNADILKKNAKALGVDLREVDFAILSHRHSDHADGFDFLLKVNPSVKLYLPHDRTLGAPSKIYIETTEKEIIESLSMEQLYFRGKELVNDTPSGRFWQANVDYVDKNTEIASGISLIFTKSSRVGNFWRYPPHDTNPYLSGLPELSLSLETTEGDVLIVGCSHSDVAEIVKEAKQYLEDDVNLVMGGFHLGPYSTEYISKLAITMRDELGVKRVAPAHCTGHLAFKIFREIYGKNYLFGGLASEIAFSH